MRIQVRSCAFPRLSGIALRAYTRAMNLTIRSHHTSVFPTFNDHATKKLERLERLLPRVGDVIVEQEYAGGWGV